ncbi:MULTISPECIES: YeeE/YedE family protein [unclassified Pseudomonas]|uniref:YeeE/YedE family protein n=1 Tax=unclassified Pseudomonas TaxID=196821 RepID=UPI00200426BB|nr:MULTISPECIES: YeeE/YedE family protein [unclassified Pseudomonas]MCK6189918.1 YeeE/YedE family protein [Pseudomonas sp. EYE_354]WLH66844.1 YeeE/YedE family protein [Pseudomonas sp. FP2309]
MRKFTALLAGLIFGLGLYLSGMTDPTKVLGFLDLAGDWDPSLALVMLGGLLVSSVFFFFARRRDSSLLGAPMQMPTQRHIDRRLVLGSLVFGMGWAIAGLCPGPALALLLTGRWQAALFTLAMVVGMLLFQALESRKRR